MMKRMNSMFRKTGDPEDTHLTPKASILEDFSQAAVRLSAFGGSKTSLDSNAPLEMNADLSRITEATIPEIPEAAYGSQIVVNRDTQKTTAKIINSIEYPFYYSEWTENTYNPGFVPQLKPDVGKFLTQKTVIEPIVEKILLCQSSSARRRNQMDDVDFGAEPKFNSQFEFVPKLPLSSENRVIFRADSKGKFLQEEYNKRTLGFIEEKSGATLMPCIEELNTLIEPAVTKFSGTYYMYLLMLAALIFTCCFSIPILVFVEIIWIKVSTFLLVLLLGLFIFCVGLTLRVRDRITLHYALAIYCRYVNLCLLNKTRVRMRPGYHGYWIEIVTLRPHENPTKLWKLAYV